MKDETEQDHMNAKNFILKFLEKYGLRSLPYALMGPVASMMNDYAEQQTKSDLERLREENERLKTELKENLPEDCVDGWGEVKFCSFRNGEGNKCKHCAD